MLTLNRCLVPLRRGVYLHCVKHVHVAFERRNHRDHRLVSANGRCLHTVPPESIDPFAAFLPRGLHASLTRYSRTQPRLYLGKTEDSIRPAAAVFWTRYYPGNKDASSLSSIFFPSCFFATKRA